MARGAELAFLAEEGTVVDGEEHRHRRLVDGDGRQGFGTFGNGDGIADFETFKTHDGTDVAARHAPHALASHTLEGVDLLDLRVLLRAVAVADGDGHALADGTAVYTSHGDAAGIVRIVEAGDEHLCVALKLLGCGDFRQYGVEQVGDVFGRGVVVLTHPSVLG